MISFERGGVRHSLLFIQLGLSRQKTEQRVKLGGGTRTDNDSVSLETFTIE